MLHSTKLGDIIFLLQFYFISRFPSDKKMREKWMSACEVEDVNISSYYICQLHFNQEDFIQQKSRLVLKHGVVPSRKVSYGVRETIITHIKMYLHCLYSIYTYKGWLCSYLNQMSYNVQPKITMVPCLYITEYPGHRVKIRTVTAVISNLFI